MTLVEHSGEMLARRIDRKRFLRRAAGTVFGSVTALAVGGIRSPTAFATGSCPNNQDQCNCHPLNSKYCTSFSSSYCSGSACAGGCTYNNSVYPDYCWCSKNCCYLCGGLSSYCGYWKCCDCTCPGHGGCTCRGFIYTCRCAAGADCVACC